MHRHTTFIWFSKCFQGMHQEYINNLLLNENCTFAPAPFLVSYVDMEAHFVSLKWNIGKSKFQMSWKKKKKNLLRYRNINQQMEWFHYHLQCYSKGSLACASFWCLCNVVGAWIALSHPVGAYFWLPWPGGSCSAGNSSAPWRDPAQLILSILREIKREQNACKGKMPRNNIQL